MKILMFGMSSYPGGIENYIVNYFCHRSFPSDKIHIDFITYEDSLAYGDKLEACGYNIYKVPHLKRNPIGYYKAVKDIVIENNYDAVYVNMLTAANVLPVYLARHFEIKKIILHAHASSTISGFTRRILHKVNIRYCNKAATLRLSCSEKAGEWLFGSNEYTVIPNAIDCDRFCPSDDHRLEIREKYGIDSQTLLMGHVGRFASEKNHTFMIEILKAVLKKGIDAKLMFVGDGYTMSEVKRKIVEENLENKIILTGTSSETEKYYPAFDVFLFPSTFEGFGMAALEAQSCGVPCICSDTLSPLLNVTGTNRYLSLQDNPEKWAEEILRDNKYDKNDMSESIGKSDYNIKRQIERLVAIIN